MRATLCTELARINIALMSRHVTLATVQNVLQFLQHNSFRLRTAFEMCAWTYPMQRAEPTLGWDAAFSKLTDALGALLAKYHPSFVEVNQARDAWTNFYTGVSAGCCSVLPNGTLGSRYVIRVSPLNGQSVCVPTLTPAKITERSYTNRMECELALSMLPRGNIALQDNVTCNEYGCFQTPQWNNVPQYN
jgi:hypothetical protein